MKTRIARRWHRTRDPQWERIVWTWGYTMCGWPMWFARYSITKYRIVPFATGRPQHECPGPGCAQLAEYDEILAEADAASELTRHDQDNGHHEEGP